MLPELPEYSLGPEDANLSLSGRAAIEYEPGRAYASGLEEVVELKGGGEGDKEELWNFKQHCIDAGTAILTGSYMIPIEYFTSGFEPMIKTRLKMWSTIAVGVGYVAMIWREAWMWNFNIDAKTSRLKRSMHELAQGFTFWTPIYATMRATSGGDIQGFNKSVLSMLAVDVLYFLAQGPLRDWYYTRKGEPPTLGHAGHKRKNKWVRLLLTELLSSEPDIAIGNDDNKEKKEEITLDDSQKRHTPT